MKIRIDAQLSPGLARWLSEHHAVEAFSVRRLGLHDATDEAIFDAARDLGKNGPIALPKLARFSAQLSSDRVSSSIASSSHGSGDRKAIKVEMVALHDPSRFSAQTAASPGG